MKNRILFLWLFLCGIVTAGAQTTGDSLALVNAEWQMMTLQKGLVCKKATFTSLYGVPQAISVLEIIPGRYNLDILVHQPKEETSVAARRSGAVAAINGSYFDMREGNSVCYLRKDGVVIDTTANGALGTVSNGAMLIRKGQLELLPWDKPAEQACRLEEGVLLVSGPLMLYDGKTCDISACNQNFVNTRHPRSAVALTRNNIILFIVVDGRKKGVAEGVSISELTHILRVLGGKDALNLDGGGSSTLWSVFYPHHEQGIINTPSGKVERKVANSLCVYQ